jgi:leader peptidase (prepilin peptidase) / N-methyltransferase
MTVLHTYLLACAGLLGLVMGSAVTAIVHRLPRGIPWTTGRSACPSCGHVLGVADLVPLLSWLSTLGRCRHCRAPISPRYPVIELTCAAWAVLAAHHVGYDPRLPAVALWGFLLIALLWIDLEHHTLPDALTFPGVVLGLLAAWPDGPRVWVYGALVGTVPLYLLLLFWEKVLKVEGMGFGDIKLGLMFGVVLGPVLGALAIFIGALAGSLAGVLMMARRRGTLRTELPFGTFLAPAALVAYLWGEPVVRAYLSLSSLR